MTQMPPIASAEHTHLVRTKAFANWKLNLVEAVSSIAPAHPATREIGVTKVSYSTWSKQAWTAQNMEVGDEKPLRSQWALISHDNFIR